MHGLQKYIARRRVDGLAPEQASSPAYRMALAARTARPGDFALSFNRGFRLAA